MAWGARVQGAGCCSDGLGVEVIVSLSMVWGFSASASDMNRLALSRRSCFDFYWKVFAEPQIPCNGDEYSDPFLNPTANQNNP